MSKQNVPFIDVLSAGLPLPVLVCVILAYVASRGLPASPSPPQRTS